MEELYRETSTTSNERKVFAGIALLVILGLLVLKWTVIWIPVELIISVGALTCAFCACGYGVYLTAIL